MLIRETIAREPFSHPGGRHLPTRGPTVVLGELLPHGKHRPAIHGPVWRPACYRLGQQLKKESHMTCYMCGRKLDCLLIDELSREGFVCEWIYFNTVHDLNYISVFDFIIKVCRAILSLSTRKVIFHCSFGWQMRRRRVGESTTNSLGTELAEPSPLGSSRPELPLPKCPCRLQNPCPASAATGRCSPSA